MSIRTRWDRFISEEELSDVGIVICIDDDDRFLIIRRSDIDKRHGQWTIPGGHVDDEDRSIENGAARELEEETNLVCDPSNLLFIGEPKPRKYYFLAKVWKGVIDVAKPNPKTGLIEHDGYKWATINDIKDIENSEIPIYLLEKALEMSKNE
jgi:8-oxo-dGTP pyrophosphatase MutT (NUDIX family)